jgi:hypothetical protein
VELRYYFLRNVARRCSVDQSTYMGEKGIKPRIGDIVMTVDLQKALQRDT